MSLDNLDKYGSFLGKFFLALITSYIFFIRFPLPDSSFDTLNYHFFNGVNGLQNFPMNFKPTEFFPTDFHQFNPIGEYASQIFYLVLGYRLGTITSLLELIISIYLGYGIIFRLLRKKSQAKNRLLILSLYLLIPFIFVVHEAFFQIGTYFSDNFYLMISMSILFLFTTKLHLTVRKPISFSILTALLSGILITKLTNLIYFIPFVIFYLTVLINVSKKFYSNERIAFLSKNAGIFLLIVIVINYQYILNYAITGNPIFPYYNAIFQSPYYENANWPFNFGPSNFIQRLFYPFYALKNPSFLGEVKEFFPDTKVIIIFLYNLFGLVVLYLLHVKINRDEKRIIFLYFLSYFLWQIFFGYSRYAIYLEILGGIISIIFSVKIFNERKCIVIKFFTILFLMYIFFQGINIIFFNLKYDFSWRPVTSIFSNFDKLTSNLIFTKYTDIDQLTKEKIKNVKFILQCAQPSSGYIATVKELRNLPILNILPNSTLNKNIFYADRQNSNFNISSNLLPINFVSISNFKGGPDSGKSREKCLKSFELNKNFLIESESITDNFVGDTSHKLSLIFGKYYP